MIEIDREGVFWTAYRDQQERLCSTTSRKKTKAKAKRLADDGEEIRVLGVTS